MRYLLVGGGTAGHINPALAIAGTIRSKEPDSEIFFAGTPDGMESVLVPKAGYKFYPIKVAGFERRVNAKNIKHNIGAVKKLILSGRRANQILNQTKPDVVIGTGGYVSGPLLRKAAKRGIKTAIHESNAFPGVTTKILSKQVDAVMIAVKEAMKYLPDDCNYYVVGNPVRKEVIDADKQQSRAKLGLDERPVLLSFGGSLGARKINETVADVIEWHAKDGKIQHIHGVGKVGMEWFPDLLKQKGIDLDKLPQVRVREYIDDMDVCLAAADLVICRSGAMTLSELEIAGKAAILIPSPYVSENHQYHNAMVLQNHGAAVVIEEKDLTGELLIETVSKLINDPVKLGLMGEKAKSLAFDDACDRIYKVIRDLTESKA